jgi:hypothetical protein
MQRNIKTGINEMYYEGIDCILVLTESVSNVHLIIRHSKETGAVARL